MITAAVLTRLGISGGWVAPLNNAMGLHEIDSDARQSMFIAQCAHESDGFERLIENLNYSAHGLLNTFPKYFTPEEAIDFAHDQARIANHVYAKRLGNGDEASGDGFKFRGRGLIQITGRTNYRACGSALGVRLLETPEMLEEQTCAALSAAWFWRSHGCNELADAGNFAGTTRRINGGLNGQEDRVKWLEKTRKAINA